MMRTWLLSLTLSLSVTQGWAQIEKPPFKKVATLEDKRINESSGLVRSIKHPGIFWTHNDSGGEPCLFAFNKDGKTVAKVRIPKAVNFDWEDLAIGPNEKGEPCLYVGDIGDNFKLRPSIQIYRVLEPDLPADPEKEIESAAPEIWHVNYPQKRFNAETLLLHPITQSLYILTKDEKGASALYKVPDTREAVKSMTMEKIADVSFPAIPREGKKPSLACQTTSGDFSPDGKRLVIASYNYLHEWMLKPPQSLKEILATPPHLILPPLTKQMEAVTYDADNASLWITSEQLPCSLYLIQR